MSQGINLSWWLDKNRKLIKNETKKKNVKEIKKDAYVQWSTGLVNFFFFGGLTRVKNWDQTEKARFIWEEGKIYNNHIKTQ